MFNSLDAWFEMPHPTRPHTFNDTDVCVRCGTPYEVAAVGRIKCRPRGTETTGVIENLYPPDRDPGDEQ